ncbi:hypothetical protein [Intestinicryptomonas porci]|uniref:ABC transporter permease n=1 Tax=Intestinicryptomonas porci TaxID=2926320 RepID=A0ABU4WG04_9BACT|nr:hypothetical protein [Opitutales bacterium CLA-KB-P66]
MRYIFRLFKRNPIAFVISSILTLATMLSIIASLAIIMVAILAPRILQEDFSEKTGFFLSTEKLFVNIISGEVEINNLRISPPKEYNESNFLTAKRVKFKIDPIKFFNGKILITEFEMDAEHLNCVKISAAKYSIRDFIYAFPGFAEFADDDKFKSISMMIEKIDYIDKSDAKIPLRWTSKKEFNITLNDIKSPTLTRKIVGEALEESGANFVLQGVNL